jgi:hypothetical protein
MGTRAGLGRAERSDLWLAAVLLLAGVLVSAVAGLFHPEGASANDHAAVFAIYAASQVWTAVHLGQFVGMALLTFGLLALFYMLDPPAGPGRWLNRIAVLCAGVNLALYGVLQGVDGVGLKKAVEAWVSADGADKAARFDVAEALRFVEWGVRSYHSFVFGCALILFGAVIAAFGKVSRGIGYLMALTGLCYLAQGWIIGVSGFSPANQIPTLLGIVLFVVWTLWLVVDAFRAKVAAGDGGEGRGRQSMSARGA